MPPELLEHFKSKLAKENGNKEESDSSKRAEALSKAKAKIEEKMQTHVLKKKQLVKRAFKQPEKYTDGELIYMKLWNSERKRLKKLRKKQKKEEQI